MSQRTPAPLSPPPLPAALTPATIGRRVATYAIDVAVATVLLLVVGGIATGILVAAGAGGNPPSLLVIFLVVYVGLGLVGLGWWLVYTAMQAGKGSIGQRLLKVQLRDAETAAPIGFWRALLRNVIFGLAGSIVVGYFTPLFDSSGRRQGWHDIVGRAIVVDVAAADAGGTGEAPAAPAASRSGAAAAPAAAASVPPAPPVPPTAPVREAPAFASPAAAPTRAGGGMISRVPGVTIDPGGPAEPAPVAAEPPAPVIVPEPAPPAAPVAPTFQAPAFVAPPAPASAPVAASRQAPTTQDLDVDETRAAVRAPVAATALVWDDGTRTAVYTRTLFGRNPAPEDGAVAVAIRDETLSLSKTHFEIAPSPGGGAYIVDRHSTNGTLLVRGGGRQSLNPGTATAIEAGDVLEFGDRRATVGGPA